MARVGTTSAEVIEQFPTVGMQEVKPHVLTDAEKTQLPNALALLPPK